MSNPTNNSMLLKITEIQGRGRSLVSTQPLKAGQVVLQDSPILLYPARTPSKNGEFSNFCSNCFKKLHVNTTNSNNLNSCPSCSHHALFCNPNCQNSALSGSHSTWVCQALNYIRYSGPNLPFLQDPDTQIQARFLVSAYNLAVTSSSNFQLLLSLQGEAPLIPNPQTQALHSFIASLSPPQSGFGFSPELTAALLAKDKQNAFGLMDDNSNSERTVRAYGIYPKASFFNHDCLPNACRFDYVDGRNSSGSAVPDNITNNTDIIIRVIHDVPEGREICLSYFPVTWNYLERQTRLKDDYGFECDCDRCKVEVNWKEEDDNSGTGIEPDNDEAMEGSDEDASEADNDFPHAYFFVKYVCDRDNCGGTLASLPPSQDGSPSVVLECNVCGRLRKEEDDMDGDNENDEDGEMLEG
ncbi:hypothetical protein MKX03_030387 [Papaver bracteatum]|nr:hypothetical protein MKX03_030387 [Papaver bracteatum]